MRNYDYKNKWKKLLTPEVVSLLTQIHEYKGEQTLFIEAKADTLTQLVEIAKIQSTEASNKIEGIYTSDERLKSLVSNKTTPRTRNEQEIAGYRDVLSTIHESHDFIPIKPSIILQLHRDLYKFSGKNIGGAYKGSDNVIAEEDSEGNKRVRFNPVPAWENNEYTDFYKWLIDVRHDNPALATGGKGGKFEVVSTEDSTLVFTRTLPENKVTVKVQLKAPWTYEIAAE